MKEDWVLVFTSQELYQAKLAEDLLKQNGIESHILNKPDSAIPAVGEAELYTPQEKAQRAVEILREHDMKE